MRSSARAAAVTAPGRCQAAVGPLWGDACAVRRVGLRARGGHGQAPHLLGLDLRRRFHHQSSRAGFDRRGRTREKASATPGRRRAAANAFCAAPASVAQTLVPGACGHEQATIQDATLGVKLHELIHEKYHLVGLFGCHPRRGGRARTPVCGMGKNKGDAIRLIYYVK